MIKGIGHVAFNVKDMDRTITFYEQTLGFKKAFDIDRPENGESFEAVTNSMKYSKCKNILITIRVMNKLVRCTIRDDGVGCNSFSDGMGISGMRRRVREVGGTLDFETVGGFTVNMLLPLS